MTLPHHLTGNARLTRLFMASLSAADCAWYPFGALGGCSVVAEPGRASANPSRCAADPAHSMQDQG